MAGVYPRPAHTYLGLSAELPSPVEGPTSGAELARERLESFVTVGAPPYLVGQACAGQGPARDQGAPREEACESAKGGAARDLLLQRALEVMPGIALVVRRGGDVVEGPLVQV